MSSRRNGGRHTGAFDRGEMIPHEGGSLLGLHRDILELYHRQAHSHSRGAFITLTRKRKLLFFFLSSFFITIYVLFSIPAWLRVLPGSRCDVHDIDVFSLPRLYSSVPPCRLAGTAGGLLFAISSSIWSGVQRGRSTQSSMDSSGEYPM